MSEKETLRELRVISKILLLANARTVESELSKVVSTTARRKMWILIDGTKSTKQIADEIGVSQRAVQIFLKDAKTTGFIDLDGEFPRRTLDYVPPEWLEVEASAEAQGQQTSPEPRPDMTLDRLVEPESKSS